MKIPLSVVKMKSVQQAITCYAFGLALVTPICFQSAAAETSSPALLDVQPTIENAQPIVLTNSQSMPAMVDSSTPSLANALSTNTAEQVDKTSNQYLLNHPSTQQIGISRPLPSKLKPEWEVGVFGTMLNQQAYPGSAVVNKKLLLVPTVYFRSEQLNLDEGGVALKAFKTPLYEIDVGMGGSLSAKSDQGARLGMNDLGFLLEAGPRLTVNITQIGRTAIRAEVPVRAVIDLSHRFKYRGLTSEPSLVAEWEKAQWKVNGSFGLLLANQQYNQMFYGVRSEYVTDTRPEYTAKAGVVALRADGYVSYQLHPDLKLFGFARVDDVHGAANSKSPLVDKKTGVSAGLGFKLTFMKSKHMVRVW